MTEASLRSDQGCMQVYLGYVFNFHDPFITRLLKGLCMEGVEGWPRGGALPRRTPKEEISYVQELIEARRKKPPSPTAPPRAYGNRGATQLSSPSKRLFCVEVCIGRSVFDRKRSSLLVFQTK